MLLEAQIKQACQELASCLASNADDMDVDDMNGASSDLNVLVYEVIAKLNETKQHLCAAQQQLAIYPAHDVGFSASKPGGDLGPTLEEQTLIASQSQSQRHGSVYFDA